MAQQPANKPDDLTVIPKDTHDGRRETASESCSLASQSHNTDRSQTFYGVAVLGRSGNFPTVMTLVFIKKIVSHVRYRSG